MAGNRRKKLIVSLSVVGGTLVLAVLVFFIYAGIYYQASAEAKKIAETSTERYAVYKSDGNIVFMPDAPVAGLVFYPGGKVEREAYAPLMAAFAERGVACVLVRMPFNLAVFNINAAEGITKKFSDIPRWFIGGHSLGGAMAAKYVADHPSEYDGLILLGAYSTEKLPDSGLMVYSIYGSNDGVLDLGKYRSNRKNLPTDTAELVINGGCHSYFGDYGLQSGDGKPAISRAEQMLITVDFVLNS